MIRILALTFILLGPAAEALPPSPLCEHPPILPAGIQVPLRYDGCDVRLNNSHICLILNWTRQGSFYSVEANLIDADLGLLSEARVTAAQLVMTMQNKVHGAPTIKVLEGANGAFILDRLFFSHRGDWRLQLTIEFNSEHVVVDYPVKVLGS